ncbi:MAG: ribulose-phosphate 3-epimerase [Erysipelotrichaceae bacterium]|nr:ribulose-phosphate 3-epimerase [Erysipelotrichaceae bacterium]
MIIAPSILSLDYTDFNKQLSVINEKCDWIHFDVMDGHFVPNLSFGPDIFRAFRKNSDLYMDVYLMVSDPDYFSDVFIKEGADGVTFHLEAYDSLPDAIRLVRKIKSRYVKAGISIKPGTKVELIRPLLHEADVVLLMSVEPGFGGQTFINSTYDKIKWLKEYKIDQNLKYLIEVDGGINNKNAHSLYDVGCDVIVAGSYIFNGDLATNIDSINFYE